MKTFQLDYQTSDLTPAPFAHWVQINGTIAANELQVRYEIKYIGRNELSQEEIEEEGFTTEDDFIWEGTFGEAWKDAAIQDLQISATDVQRPHEDIVSLKIDGKEGIPTDTELARVFVEQLRQAIFEKELYEMPLKITIVQIKNGKSENAVLHASFESRVFTLSVGADKKQLPWGDLEKTLQPLYSGEFDYENARTKSPSRQGLHVNLGDEWWFELGKSYHNSPSKLEIYFR